MAKRFENVRKKQLIQKDSVKLLSFTAQFYRTNMNPIHRWIVLALFKRSSIAHLKGKKKTAAIFQYLSQFVQSFAGFSVNHVSKIPPKIDIYSMGTRLGLANFFWKKQQLTLCRIFCFGADPDIIDIKKRLIASNYREDLNLPAKSEAVKDQDSARQALPLKQA